MKTFSSFFKTLTLCLILLATSVSAWGSDPHFYLNGKTTKIENYYGQDSKYSIYVWMTTNSTFYLNNGTNNYGPNTNNTVINANTDGASGGYNSNKWKYTGATGLVRICVDQASNEWYPSIWVEEMGSILTGNDIMFYYGDTWGWGTKYLNKTTTNDYKNGNAGWQLSSTYCTVVRAAAGQKYWISNSDSWLGVQMSNNAAAGALYSLTNNNGNKINVTSGKIPKFSTTAYAITVGTATSGISATVNNTSSAGRANTLYYYYSTNGGNSWIGFDVNDVDELTEGEYQIAAIACDGFICVKSSNTATLTINPNTYSLTVEAGTGIESVTGSADPITLGNTYDIKATPKTGYTFSTWTAEPAANATFGSATTANTTVTVNNGSVTVTASATENMSTLTTSNKYDVGDPGYTIPTKTANSIGIATTATIKATAAGNGYTFTGWTLTNCTRTDGGADNATSITVRSNGDGKAATVVANYAEDLTSEWHLVGNGNIFPDGWNVNNNSMMKKISGKSTESIVALKVNVTTVQTYEFKIVDDNGSASDTWYGYSTGNTFLTWTETSTKDVYTKSDMSENSNNLKFTPNAVGDYEFKVDYSGTNPKVTITYPELSGQSIYLYGEFNDWQANEDYKFEEDANGLYTLTRRFEKRERWEACGKEQAEYEFKLNINGTNYTVEGDGDKKLLQYTRQNTTKVVNDGTTYSGPFYNLLLQADITGEYLFTYDPKTQKMTVTHPEYPEASYIVGDFSDGKEGTDAMPCNPNNSDEGHDWTEKYGIPITVDGNTGSVEVCKWPAGEWEFKVKINGLWYGLKDLNITQSGTYELTDDYAEMGDRNVSMITTNGECYSFTYTQNNDGTLDVLVIFGNETHAVSFNANGHGTAPATQNIHYMKTASEPTMADVDDYMFGGWYTDATCTQKYDFSTPVTEDITLYAKWIPYTQCIFFKNNLGWKDVFVYTFSDNVWYDNEDGETKYGPGVCTKTQNNLHYGEMTQIGESDIFYFILPNTTGFNHIAFSDFPMNDWNEFYGHNAIYRSDRSDQMSLFIPQTDQTASTTNSTKYYSSGIWMKYNSTESGYDWRGATSESESDSGWKTGYNFIAEKAGGYTFKASVPFNNVNQHYFKIHNIVNDWFGNGGTMTQKNCTDWIFGTDNSSNAKITPTITGEYNFTIYLGDGEVSVSLDYPLSVGDYRLAYKDNTTNSHHPGHYLKKHSDTQTDTVSFFIHHHDQQPEIIVEECTKIQNGIPTWEKVEDITNNPAASITESGVYNFFLQQVEGKTLPTLVNKAMPYTGSFYIRTDAADGGWDSFRQKSNEITYSSFADTHSNFNHYYCKYIDAGRNVKFTIANDYSYCISDTLDNDDIIKNGQSSIGCLPINANVRFGWDSNTNEISRAYIKGAGMTSDRFLVLQGQDSNLKDANGNVIPKGTGTRTGLEANEEILVDQQNWIYQVEVTANNQTFIKLIAEYKGAVQYFKGDAENYARLLSSTTANSYKIRLVYDFKSNNLVAAMVLDGNKEVEKDDALGTDMMVIRRNQGHAEQLTFNPDSRQLTEVGRVYAVMTFTSEWINGTAKARERSLYWVSFPFDVKVSDVFGFGEYGEEWILQYYDGAERAEKGLFGDSGTYWKYIEDTKTTLNAGTGYVLALDLSKVKFLHGATEVSLYFPSKEPVKIISGKLPTAATVPEHRCYIDREWTEGEIKYNHKYTDSHWNLIGVPGFADITGFDVTQYSFMQEDASFYYNFSLANSRYNVESSTSTSFNAMYAYMVQFAGKINWSLKTVAGIGGQPKELAARRSNDMEPEKVVLRLELTQGEEKVDQTFVQLQQEGATANFDLSLDLTKIMNSGFSNIYTLTDSLKIQVAGNALPMEETVVPVGVNIAAAGEYTFRMPDGTEGMVVELVDYETNTRTNLLLSDYIVTLPKGTSENRFALHIQPEKQVETGVDNIGEGVNNGEAVNKYLIDGKLIIRTAEGVFDAQGHRL